MGRPRKRTSRFNPPTGRHSVVTKRKYSKFKASVGKRVETVLSSLKTFKQKSYQVVARRHSFVSGRSCVNLIVRRLRQVRLRPLAKPGSLKIAVTPPTDVIDGYRLVDVNIVQQHFSRMSQHIITCAEAMSNLKKGQDAFSVSKEIRRQGLPTSLVFLCSCGKTFFMDSSPNVQVGKLTTREINLRAVWGSMVCGNGLSQLNEMLATMGVPTMSPSTYSSLEHSIGDMWSSCLEDDLRAAGAEERRLAVERGHYHQGVPAITVICDGGWSKRSHKHTYDALGGVAVIFGAVTGKLLHVGIRNKHCHVCTLAETKHVDPPTHECFKNWTDSSQAMEADIISEGFCQAEHKHGLRYMKLIADGDSSVLSTIQQTVPVWGKDVVKMECANHACKCLRSNLEKLVTDKPYYKGKGKLTRLVRIRLATAVRCAIRMRSKGPDRSSATVQLERDIRNSVHHIFGDHRNCSNFCKSRSPAVKKSHATDRPTATDVEGCVDDGIANDQVSYWEEGTAEEDMEESRGDVCYEAALDRDMLRDISILLDRLASKAARLIGNFTTNLAESWMSIRATFDGGKMVNRCNRGSWHARCFGGALRKNFGPAWSPTIFQKCTNVRPGQMYTNLYRQRSMHLLRSIKSKQKPDVKGRARKRKMKSSSVATSKKAKKEYGTEVPDPLPDVTPTQLSQHCDDFMATHINLSTVQCNKIQQVTKSQSLSATWKEERRIRLTASNFGEVVKKNVNRPVKPLVDRMLYNSFKGNTCTSHGLAQESSSIKEYVQFKADRNEDVAVKPMGLVIDLQYKFLAASTDGMVEDSTGNEVGLLELINLLQRNLMSFQEAANKASTFCLETSGGSTLTLKRKHNFYYQCQGQLNILKKPWLDFVVRRSNPNQIHVKRIFCDEVCWESHMLLKLQAFYQKALLPELASPRHGLSPGVREPDKPWFVPQRLDEPCSNSNNSSNNRKCMTRQKRSFTKKVEAKASNLEPTPGTSSDPDPPVSVRSRRKRFSKFVGRKILHQWCVDDKSGKSKWYSGIVLDCVKGKDGDPSADYEVSYDGEKEQCIVDSLQKGLDSGCLKFIDIYVRFVQLVWKAVSLQS